MEHSMLGLEKFNSIDLDDPFFDTLKADYPTFSKWFKEKHESEAYTFRSSKGAQLDGFLYIKRENGEVGDVDPPMQSEKRIKIGTFKINPHGTRLGERFIKRIFDAAISEGVDSIYVTVYEKHASLIELFERYGFKRVGVKNHDNDYELVLERRLDSFLGDVVLDYPRIPLRKNRHFLISILPDYHSKLLPDSLLKTESQSILQDVSHTNSIHKIYLSGSKIALDFAEGDTLLIYRMSDGGSAYYTSVVTSLCVVEEVTHISKFLKKEEFLKFCEPYSIFTTKELDGFYHSRKYPYIIRFTYNMALTKRLNRKMLLEEVGLPDGIRWTILPIETEQLKKILKLSGDYEKTRSLVYTP